MQILHAFIGVALTFAGWYVPRIVAQAKFRLCWALLVDLIPSLLGFLVFLSATARPVFSGILVFALMGGFAFVDWVKRATLREPVIFSDIAEAIELFRHPDLYLPFAGPTRVIAGVLGVLALFIVVFFLDRPMWAWSPARAVFIPAMVLASGAIIHWSLIHRTAQAFRRLRPVGEPFADAAELGPSAMQFTYSFIARDERPARQAAVREAGRKLSIRSTTRATPVILVQSESFFDPRRLHPGVAMDILPCFDACRGAGVQSGLLDVSAWGANTMRAEFAVLSGLPDDAIGYDRFNPYFAFARTKLPSLASRMRAAGYRTICVHPFDRTFYRRDEVMLNLGFDAFIGEEAFRNASRSGAYISDDEAGKLAIDLLHKEGPRVFIFVITMENHGPWNLQGASSAAVRAVANLPAIPEKAAFARFVEGAMNADRMLGSLTAGLSAFGEPGLCAFYGDHLPSFPEAFAALDFHETRSDYVIWHGAGGGGRKKNIAAYDLAGAIIEALKTEQALARQGA